MRGALPVEGLARADHRIIPADAGSTSANGLSYPGRSDHPRGCGEHLLSRFNMDGMAGSSPRMRGAR